MNGHDALEWLLKNTDEYFWNQREAEFIADMASWGRFTPRQEKWLIDIYNKFEIAMRRLPEED